jgi:cleavage stimulation factor subunit 3
MEYHSSDDKGIPGRIFEKGLELFGDEIDYVQRYLGFLISINDINSAFLILLFFLDMADDRSSVDARALFERVIGNFPPERARPLWERWARYEYQYGDLEAALKLEKRMAEVYPVGMYFLFPTFFFIDGITKTRLSSAWLKGIFTSEQTP